jgi:hypothetical protein
MHIYDFKDLMPLTSSYLNLFKSSDNSRLHFVAWYFQNILPHQVSFSTFKVETFYTRKSYWYNNHCHKDVTAPLKALKLGQQLNKTKMHWTYRQQNAPRSVLCPHNLLEWQVHHATCSKQDLPTALEYVSAATQMPLDSCVAENVSDII